MKQDQRYQQGKHLTLVEDRHLAYIGNIPRHIIPAFALWRGLCREGRELVEKGELDVKELRRIEGLEAALNESLRLTVSVGARGRADLTNAIRGLEEDRIHREAGTFGAEPVRPKNKGLRPD